MTPRLTACLLFVRGGPAWQIMFALVQATVAQAGSTALAAQAQPQPVTPWQPVAGTPSGNLSMQASIPTPATNAAYKESWYNSPGRWCKPSNQDPVTGPGQHCSLHPMPCSCPNRLTVSMMEIALLVCRGMPSTVSMAVHLRKSWNHIVYPRSSRVRGTTVIARASRQKQHCMAQVPLLMECLALHGPARRRPVQAGMSALSAAFWAQGSWSPALNSAAMALQTTPVRHRAAGHPASSAAMP